MTNKNQKRGLSPFLDPFLEEEKMLRRIPLEIIALSFIAALLALPFFDHLTSLFILAGGALAALSFVWLKQSVSRLLLPQTGDRTSRVEKGDSPSKEKGQSPFSKSPSSTTPFLTGSFFTSNFTTKALKSALLLYALRLVLILGIFFIIIFFFSKKIIAFAAGFSALVPVFLVEAAIALSRMKQWKS